MLTRLQENDEKYSANFKTGGAIPDLNMRNAKLSTIEKARNMAMSSLSTVESFYKDTESSLNFSLTTIGAISAVVISVLGIA